MLRKPFSVGGIVEAALGVGEPGADVVLAGAPDAESEQLAAMSAHSASATGAMRRGVRVIRGRDDTSGPTIQCVATPSAACPPS